MLNLNFIRNKTLFVFLLGGAAYLSSCSPIKSSPREEKHQMELTLHEVQTNIDDLRHDVNCYQTELQILDSKIKHHENALTTLKEQFLENQQTKINQVVQQINNLEKNLNDGEKNGQAISSDIRQLTVHANETSSALSQYKSRINEMEKEVLAQNRRFDEVVKLKSTLDSIAKVMKVLDNIKTYKVKAGDSLEKIARSYKISVESIKELNNLDNDLIVIGQELKIPNENL